MAYHNRDMEDHIMIINITIQYWTSLVLCSPSFGYNVTNFDMMCLSNFCLLCMDDKHIRS